MEPAATFSARRQSGANKELTIVKFDDSTTKLAKARLVEPGTDPAAEINRLHSEICGLGTEAARKAVEIGGLLVNEKSKFKFGEWQSWIKGNLTISSSLVNRYMRCYINRERLKLNREGSVLTIMDLAKSSKESKNRRDRKIKVKVLTFTHALGDKTATIVDPLPTWFAAKCEGNSTIIVCRKCRHYSRGHIGLSLSGKRSGAGVSCECVDSERMVEFTGEAAK